MEPPDDDAEIVDNRSLADFKKTTFSMFKRGDVKKELLNSLAHENIEHACFWSAELVCSGALWELWECFTLYLSKNITISNPKLPVYLNLRRGQFGRAMRAPPLEARNSPVFRALVAEIVAALCFSPRRPAYEFIKIDSDADLSTEVVIQKCQAPNTDYIRGIFRREDPREIFIAANEFAFSLDAAGGRGPVAAYYWLEWFFLFDAHCRATKQPLRAARRELAAGTDFKHGEDCIWLFWEILRAAAAVRGSLYEKTVDSLYELFSFGYEGGAGAARKRKHIMYHSIMILLEPCNWNIEMLHHREEIQKVVSQIDNVYMDMKTRAHRKPNHYLEMIDDMGGADND